MNARIDLLISSGLAHDSTGETDPERQRATTWRWLNHAADRLAAMRAPRPLTGYCRTELDGG